MYSKRASIYQTEYIEDRDVLFLKNLIQSQDCSVLEIPCGAGRLAIQLAGHVSNYAIADLEESMVLITKDRILKSGISSDISTYVTNMSKKSIPEKYDWVIVPREALQLLSCEDAINAIANLCNLLKRKNGRLLIDLASFSVSGDPDYYYPHQAEGEWFRNWTRSDENGLSITRWSKQEESEDRINFFYNYEKENEDQSYSKFESQMTLHKFTHDFIHAHIPNGYKIYKKWGGYDQSPWKEDSNRIIFLIGEDK